MLTFHHPDPAGAPQLVVSEIVERMADKMLELGMNGIAVDADTLFEHSDFTRDEIRTHGREAADLARGRSVRQRAA